MPLQTVKDITEQNLLNDIANTLTTIKMSSSSSSSSDNESSDSKPNKSHIKPDFSIKAGDYIEIWEPDYQDDFRCTVIKFNESKTQIRVCYDDNEWAWKDIEKLQYKIISNTPPAEDLNLTDPEGNVKYKVSSRDGNVCIIKRNKSKPSSIKNSSHAAAAAPNNPISKKIAPIPVKASRTDAQAATIAQWKLPSIDNINALKYVIDKFTNNQVAVKEKIVELMGQGINILADKANNGITISSILNNSSSSTNNTSLMMYACNYNGVAVECLLTMCKQYDQLLNLQGPVSFMHLLLQTNRTQDNGPITVLLNRDVNGLFPSRVLKALVKAYQEANIVFTESEISQAQQVLKKLPTTIPRYSDIAAVLQGIKKQALYTPVVAAKALAPQAESSVTEEADIEALISAADLKIAKAKAEADKLRGIKRKNIFDQEVLILSKECECIMRKSIELCNAISATQEETVTAVNSLHNKIGEAAGTPISPAYIIDNTKQFPTTFLQTFTKYRDTLTRMSNLNAEADVNINKKLKMSASN